MCRSISSYFRKVRIVDNSPWRLSLVPVVHRLPDVTTGIPNGIPLLDGYLVVPHIVNVTLINRVANPVLRNT
jgi:hypothetical protein